MNSEKDFKSINYNIIGKETTIEGNLNLSGDTIIAGTVLGDIMAAPNTNIILERDSLIKGNMNCFQLEIFGDFEGTLLVHSKLIIRSSAKVTGKIEASSLVIYPGALVNMEGRTLENSPIDNPLN